MITFGKMIKDLIYINKYYNKSLFNMLALNYFYKLLNKYRYKIFNIIQNGFEYIMQ